MKMKDLKEQLDLMEARLNTIVGRLDDIETGDRKWRKEHEANHHGAKSNLLHGVPWTVIAIVGSAVFQILSGLP